jgi:hypothetical protein
MGDKINIEDINIYTNRPAGVAVHHLRGDWMEGGYINNYNRNRYLTIAIIDGVAYVEQYGGWLVDHGHSQVVTVDDNGEIPVGGASWGFLPDAGEFERIGIKPLAAA